VVEDALGVELLEQAASANAQTGTSTRLIDRFPHRALGMAHVTTATGRNGG
jgi:hypothetical protein